MRISGLSLLLFLAVASLNCKKDGTSEQDSPGTIIITLPGAGGNYDNGFLLKVEGEMADNNLIGTAKLEIRNKSTNALLTQQSVQPGNVGFYRFAWTWTVAGVTSSFTATVKVTNVDKLGNQIVKEVDVILNP